MNTLLWLIVFQCEYNSDNAASWDWTVVLVEDDRKGQAFQLEKKFIKSKTKRAQ